MSSNERWFPGHLREIDRAECLELLGSHQVGRVAYCDDDGPVVLPVTYVLEGDVVLFRTAPESAMASRLRSAPASFQIDEFDDYTQTGWSVLVRGQAEYVEYADLPDPASRPEPWAEGHRMLHIRIWPSEITGRRVLEA
jgi:hypothetical protein